MANSKIRIAVTGAGGGVGQSIIKSLEGTDYEVIAMDGEPLATGLYAAHKSYVIPYVKEDTYLPRLLEICAQEQCALLFPGLDAELPALSGAVDRFKNIGTKVVVSSARTVQIADNKLLTFTELAAHGVSVPKTVDLGAFGGGDKTLPPFPLVLKPREGGARSQGLHIIADQEQFDAFIAAERDVTKFVAQEQIVGDEYTCGTINLEGQCKGVIVMRRMLRDGDTYKCFSVHDTNIEKVVRDTVAAIKPFGACNVQLRVRDGRPYVFEINARCSGTTAARTLCGFNEPKMIADFLLFNKVPEFEIKELTILRYWKELVVRNEAVAELERHATLNSGPYVPL